MNREHARRVYFEQIKRVVPLSAILERFGILPELKRVGTQLKGCCPIHRGSNPRQFVVDLNKNVWHCFSPQCDRGGGVFEFVSELENVGIEEAARRVGEWFAVALPSQKHSTDTQRRKAMSGERPSYKVFAVEDKGDDDKKLGGRASDRLGILPRRQAETVSVFSCRLFQLATASSSWSTPKRTQPKMRSEAQSGVSDGAANFRPPPSRGAFFRVIARYLNHGTSLVTRRSDMTQLAFFDVLAEADAQEQAARDRCRSRAQLWFDELSEGQKLTLATLLATREWDTCASLSAAAGDWYRSRTERAHTVVLRRA